MALCWFATGCSSDAQELEYSLPADLCGVDASENLYAALFPAGREVEFGEPFSGEGFMQSVQGCEVRVDGRGIIWSGTAAWNDFDDLINTYDLPVEVTSGEPVPGDHEALAWPGVAAAQAHCPGLGAHDSFMIYVRSEYPEDEAESQQMLSELIQPYMAAALELIPEHQCGS